MKIKTLFLSGLVAVILVSLFSCAQPKKRWVPPGGPTDLQYPAGGGGYKTWNCEAVRAAVENEHYTMSLVPVCGAYIGCNAFVLNILNKTNKNIELNWNKTLYICGGQTFGGFMFEGIVCEQRNNPKPPDLIFGNSTFTKKILPNNLVDYKYDLVDYEMGQSGREHEAMPALIWEHKAMPEGENGAYISLIIDGKEVGERLLFRFSHM